MTACVQSNWRAIWTVRLAVCSRSNDVTITSTDCKVVVECNDSTIVRSSAQYQMDLGNRASQAPYLLGKCHEAIESCTHACHRTFPTYIS